MMTNFTESLKYALLTLLVNTIHHFNIFILAPFKWLLGKIVPSISNKDKLKQYYSNKTCIVTGATSGIGFATFKLLASYGANIIISSRGKDKLEDLAALCRLEYPKVLIFPIVLDLEKYQGVDKYIIQVMNTLKDNNLPQKVDVLLNIAGMSSRGAAMDTSMETLERIMNVNFYGPVALTKSVSASMILQGGGVIGVVSSVQGKFGIPYRTAYASSKHAVQGYFDGLRAELSPHNITVTIVSPGYVNTSLSLNALNADGTAYNKADETTASGMNPLDLSEIMLLSIANGEADTVVADAKTNIGIQIKVLMPELFSRMMKQRIKQY